MEETSPVSDSTPISQPEFEYAGFGRRLLAYIVDFGILFLFGLIIPMLFGQQHPASTFFNLKTIEELQTVGANSGSNFTTMIMFFFGLVYTLIFWVNYDGATPGKRIMGIKIIKDDRSKLTYSAAFIRYVGMLISAFFFYLGYFWMIWDKKKQGWHDKMAKTYVVKTGAKPKTWLAIILALFFILITTVYSAIIFSHMFSLIEKEIAKQDISRTPYQSREQNKQSMSAEAKAHYDKAQAQFDKLQANTDDPEKLKPIANLAITESELAIKIEPKNALIWELLGSAYTWPNTIGDDESSLKAFEKAEKLDPKNVVYINNVGDELIKLGRNGDAVLQLQKALRLTDTSGYSHLSIGIAYKNLKINESAKTHFDKAIEMFTNQNDKGQFDDEILKTQKEKAGLSQ